MLCGRRLLALSETVLSCQCFLRRSLLLSSRLTNSKVKLLYVRIVYWIEVNLKNLKTTLINRTQLRTKGQSAGYLQAQIEITSNSFQRRAP